MCTKGTVIYFTSHSRLPITHQNGHRFVLCTNAEKRNIQVADTTCRPDIRTCWLLHWFSYHAWSNDSCREQGTNPNQQSPSWEGKSSPVSQEIPYILWYAKAHYHIHNSPPLVLIPSQSHLVHNIPSYFFRIHFNIILLFHPKSSKWPLSFRFPHQKPVCISLLLYTGCPRRNVPDFGRVFLILKYTDITQHTYVQSWTVTEIMAREVWNFDSCYTLIDYQIHIKTGRNMWFL